jgi:hypothetical protein
MSSVHRIFTDNDAGCHADGTFGHQHVRDTLGDLLVDASDKLDGDLLVSLQGTMPDDAWDEDEALEALQSVTDEGLTWELHDGDLVLL